MNLKLLLKTNLDLVLALLITIPVVYLGSTLKISDFLQACVAIIPITLVALSVFFAFNKKFILLALKNNEYSKQLYRAFLTPAVSSLLSFIVDLFALYNRLIYFLAVLLLLYSLFSLITLIIYLSNTYKKLVRHNKL